MNWSTCRAVGALAAVAIVLTGVASAEVVLPHRAPAATDVCAPAATQPAPVAWDAPVDPTSDRRIERKLTAACRKNVDVQAVCRNARKAPALPRPQGQVVRVRTAEELRGAIEAGPDGVTILVADGVYHLDNVLLTKRSGVTIRSESGNREKVVLDGEGLQKLGQRRICIRVHGCHDFTIADMTIQNYEYGLMLYGDGDLRRPLIHNMVFRNIWVRGVKGTHPQRIWDDWQNLGSVEQAEKTRPRDGRIQYCLFTNETAKEDRDDGFDGDYVSGIDMMWLKHWAIADNVFVNIRGRNGVGRGAIFVWVRCENVVAERNTIVNCDRGIAFGNPSGDYPHMTGGIARNNFIVAGASQAIEFHQTADSIACNNTVWGQDLQYRRTIEFQTGNTGARFYNNLVHGSMYIQKDGVDLRNNAIGDLAGWFAAPTIGDLHLAGKAIPGLRGVPLGEVKEDFDRQIRGPTPLIGADEVIEEARK